ncbi:Putative uncharacterized protein [Avibacterium paragallinarum JF4211]|nr:hypothetical protein C3364_05320 [Avibacterium paragallinarum]RZN75093.1 hypothetical protein EC523_09840 [Avibacterium paragallinarum]CDF98865.1 Putative uncharacterized protein [Avibacterium paragallinarum JF4211]
MIFLAKLGFTPQQVREMSHLEVSAWVESLLQSQGAKPQASGISKGDTVHYNLVRRKKQDGA